MLVYALIKDMYFEDGDCEDVLGLFASAEDAKDYYVEHYNYLGGETGHFHVDECVVGGSNRYEVFDESEMIAK